MLFLLAARAAGHAVAESLEDVAFGFWTGAEMLNVRIQALAQTWLRLVPEVHIYTDNVTDEMIQKVLDENNHLNLKFHIVNAPSNELVGTGYYNPWGLAQDRHMAAVADLSEREPHKMWYFFGDDDTYVFPENILPFLRGLNPDDQMIYGQVFGAWARAHVIFPLNRRSKGFAQGGAGVVIGRGMMNALRPHLRKCREVFRTGVAASDMRLGACVVRYIGERRYTSVWKSLYGDRPENKIRYPQDLQIALHHVVPPDLKHVANSHTSEWKLKNGTDVYVDWSHLSLVDFVAPVGEIDRHLQVMWGFRIFKHLSSPNGKPPHSKNYSVSIERPVPIFDESGNPIAFTQRFHDGITFKYICDTQIPRGNIVFDSFIGPSDGYGSVFRIFCPRPRQFIHAYPSGSPFNVTREPHSDL